MGGTVGLQEDDNIPVSTPSLTELELVCAELLSGSRRSRRSILSSANLVGLSRSPSVVILNACLNSCPPVVLPSPVTAGLERDCATGGARTVPSSGVFLPWGRGMVMLLGVQSSKGSLPGPELSWFGEWDSVCTGSWTDGGLSQVGGTPTDRAVSSCSILQSLL